MQWRIAFGFSLCIKLLKEQNKILIGQLKEKLLSYTRITVNAIKNHDNLSFTRFEGYLEKMLPQEQQQQKLPRKTSPLSILQQRKAP